MLLTEDCGIAPLMSDNTGSFNCCAKQNKLEFSKKGSLLHNKVEYIVYFKLNTLFTY